MVRMVHKQIRASGTGICCIHGHRRHSNQPKTPDVEKQVVLNRTYFIQAYESHYSRLCISKKYLSPDLPSISKMYRLYKSQCEKKHIQCISKRFYSQIFTEEFNLAFRKPKNNTCARCDRLDMIMQSSTVQTCLLYTSRCV